MDGHIKLYRKFLDWEWYQDINTKVLFIHMLMKANWKDGKFMGTTIPRGSFYNAGHIYPSSVPAPVEEASLSPFPGTLIPDHQ